LDGIIIVILTLTIKLHVKKNKLRIQDLQKTKIVATVGPACSSRETLLELIRAGVDVFRLNFSHGSHSDHKIVLDHIHEINKTYGIHIGILADLQGPKLRVGEIENNGIQLKKHDIITFVNKQCIGTKEKIYMSYKTLAKDVKVGERSFFKKRCQLT